MNQDINSDESIVLKVQNGDSERFGILIERYEKKLLRYGKRFLFQYEDVEDAVQDVFMKAYINIQSFKLNMSFSPWIYRVAHNTFINLIKKKGKEPLALFDSDTIIGTIASKEDPEKELMDVEDSRLIEKSVGRLDPKYREPLILFYYENKDYKEISDVMRIPISTVGVRIRRGRALIKKLYKEHA